jgi:hypothetical protein
MRRCNALGVDGHQDLPSDGHEVDVMAITDSDRICWASRREICSCRIRAMDGWPECVGRRIQIIRIWAPVEHVPLPEVISKGHVERLGLNVRFFKKHLPAHTPGRSSASLRS